MWFISSPLTAIYVIVEKYHFGFHYNFFNLITRLLSLTIGGLLGSARIALILFSMSGIVLYGYLCLKMMSYSGVKVLRVLKIVFSNFILFVPAGIIIVALKIAGINQIVICYCFWSNYWHLLPVYFEKRYADEKDIERIPGLISYKLIQKLKIEFSSF